MDDNLNVEETGLGINIEPQAEEGVIHTPKVEEEGKIDEFPEELIGVEEEDDLDKKTYYKITPTLFIKPILLEEGEEAELDEEGNKIELFKILDPEKGVVEERQLTDEEKHEIRVFELKESKKVFQRTKHPVKTVGTHLELGVLGRERRVKDREVVTNITINKYNSAFKAKRKRRNSLTKQSRRANR